MLLLSSDLQDFGVLGLQFRDKQFSLSLIILVAFEYYANIHSMQ